MREGRQNEKKERRGKYGRKLRERGMGKKKKEGKGKKVIWGAEFHPGGLIPSHRLPPGFHPGFYSWARGSDRLKVTLLCFGISTNGNGLGITKAT